MMNLKGKRGEAASMALLVLAMAIVTDLESPAVSDYLSLMVLILCLARIIWIFPPYRDETGGTP